MSRNHTPSLGLIGTFVVALALGMYFTFAAVQGDYGLFRRAEINAEADKLHRELDALNLEVARMENITRRMSDDYLDLDLLDQQARDVLGQVRTDEIIVQ
jgi:cell division protein FtsB